MGDSCRDRDKEWLLLGDPSYWSQWAESILVHMAEANRTYFKKGSRRSTTEARLTHRSLEYDLGVENYFTDAFTVEKKNPPTKLYHKRDSQRHCVPDLQYEGAGERHALYRTLPHSTGYQPAAFCQGNRVMYTIRWMGNVGRFSTTTRTLTRI